MRKISKRAVRGQGFMRNAWIGYIVVVDSDIRYDMPCNKYRATKTEALQDAEQKRLHLLGQVGA